MWNFIIYKLWLVPACWLLLVNVAKAQDPQVSQFYSNPLYLNPAFTGLLNPYCKDKPANRLRAVVNYRQQWKHFNTTFGSVDYVMPTSRANQNLGLGFRFYNDQFGEVNTLQFALDVSYMMPINQYWRMAFGLEGSYSNRQWNSGGIRWPDQFDNFGYNGNFTADAAGLHASTMYPDMGAGFVLYNAFNWVGLSARNILRPNQAVLGTESPLPIRYSLHAGRRFYLDGLMKKFLVLTGQYKLQRRFQQLDVGAYVGQRPFVVGLWYRGLPLLNQTENTTLLNHDAIVTMVGFFYKNFNLAYSYDITISNIGPIAGGAHELSLRIRFVSEKCRAQSAKGALPCPGHLNKKLRQMPHKNQNLPFPFPNM